jgi:hypothetical protein
VWVTVGRLSAFSLAWSMEWAPGKVAIVNAGDLCEACLFLTTGLARAS